MLHEAPPITATQRKARYRKTTQRNATVTDRGVWLRTASTAHIHREVEASSVGKVVVCRHGEPRVRVHERNLRVECDLPITHPSTTWPSSSALGLRVGGIPFQRAKHIQASIWSTRLGLLWSIGVVAGCCVDLRREAVAVGNFVGLAKVHSWRQCRGREQTNTRQHK